MYHNFEKKDQGLLKGCSSLWVLLDGADNFSQVFVQTQFSSVASPDAP